MVSALLVLIIFLFANEMSRAKKRTKERDYIARQKNGSHAVLECQRAWAAYREIKKLQCKRLSMDEICNRYGIECTNTPEYAAMAIAHQQMEQDDYLCVLPISFLYPFKLHVYEKCLVEAKRYECIYTKVNGVKELNKK